MMQILEFLVKLVGTITPILLFLMGVYIKRRDDKHKLELAARDKDWEKKVDVRMNLVIDKNESLETKIMEILRILEDHVGDDTFRKDYRKKIKFVLSSNLKNNLLHQDYKSLLFAFEEIYEKFGLNYYYSPERHMIKREREKYLNHQRQIVYNEFKAIVYEIIQGIKVFNNSKVHFFEYLKEIRIFDSFDLLIVELGRDGLTDEKIIEKFEEYMDKFCDNLITSTVVWDSLNKPEFKKDVA